MLLVSMRPESCASECLSGNKPPYGAAKPRHPTCASVTSIDNFIVMNDARARNVIVFSYLLESSM